MVAADTGCAVLLFVAPGRETAVEPEAADEETGQRLTYLSPGIPSTRYQFRISHETLLEGQLPLVI